MNWLAHVFLSEPETEPRLGQVIADWVKGADRAQFSPGIQRGISCHIEIDRFTDTHPVVIRSMERIQSPFKRYAAVLVDVFYDYVLSCEWGAYCSIPLPAFVSTVYAGFSEYLPILPPRVRTGFEHMITADWLGSYGTASGVDTLLRRISGRLTRTNNLGDGVSELLAHDHDFRQDFAEFFPALQKHTHVWMQSRP